MEGIDRGPHRFFVHHQRQAFGPPLVKRGAELLDHRGVLRDDVVFLAVVDAEVEELPIRRAAAVLADHRPARVAHGGDFELRFVGIAELRPTAKVGELVAVGQFCGGILEQRHEAAAFDLGLRDGGRHFGSGDRGERREKIDVGGEHAAVGG